MRQGDDLVETTWSEALDIAAGGLAKAVERDGGAGVAVIGGARGTNEDAYAWSKLAGSCSAPTTSIASSATGSPPR